MKLWSRLGKVKVFLIVMVVGAVSILTVGQAQAAYFSGYPNNSPDPGLNPSIRHILINSSHGKSATLTLKVYYNKNLTLPEGAYDQIVMYDPGLYGGTGDVSTKCTILDAVSYNTQVLSVSGSIAGIYNWSMGTLNANQLCQNGATPPGTGAYKDVKGKIWPVATNAFQIPWNVVNSAPVRPESDMKEVIVTFQLADPGGYHDATAGDSGEITVSFQVASVYGRLASTMAIGGKNNAVVPRQGGGPDSSMNATYSFGSPCNQQEYNNPSWQPLTVYDLDSNKSGFYVEESVKYPNGTYSGWNRLQRDQYSSPSGTATGRFPPEGWNSSNSAWYSYKAEASNASVYIKMYPQNRYRLTLFGLRHLGNVQGLGNNYAFVGVPGDMIFGDPTFSCPYYNLTPNIAIGIDRFTGQANIPIGADISQGSADDPVGENHNWFVTKAVFKAPINRGAVALSDDEPCTYFNKKSSNALRHGVCEEAIGGGKIYPGSGNYFGTRPTGNIPLGYYICYMTSVQNPTSRSDDDSKWRHSDIKCAQSVAIPKLQVHGGDLRVASDSNCTAKKGFINTSMSRIDGRHYGSWSEFASFSQCSDSNFTTGAELESGQASVTPIDPYHGLTFANGGGSYGSYSTDTNIVRGVQPITDCPASVPSDHRFSSFGAFKLSVDEGNVAGSYCVGNSSSNLNVDSDVKLTGKPSGIKQIPQVILIGKDINIHEGVSRLDAWLLASGDLNTCTNSTNNRNATLKSTVCNNQLVINGPVYTNKLYPDRTFGSRDENDKAKAGEVFNLPASTSIWLYNQSKTSGAIDTVSLKELPPRY